MTQTVEAPEYSLAPLQPPAGPREAPPAPLVTGSDPSLAAMPGSRLPFIDGLRGLAILMVLAFHCWLHTNRMSIPVRIGRWRIDVLAPLHFGHLGVNLFLVLSGFCLTYPLARRGLAGMHLDLVRFARRRAWRILPPYYVALAGFVLLDALSLRLHIDRANTDALTAGLTAGSIISHVFMFHNLSPAWILSINGSFWSLALEWQLYIVFPLLVWGFRRCGMTRTVLAVLVLTLIYRIWAYATQDLSSAAPPHSVPSALSGQLLIAAAERLRGTRGLSMAWALPGRLFEFVLGMQAAVLLAQMRKTPGRAWTCRYFAGAAALGLLGFCAAQWWSPYAPFTDVIWGLACFCLVMYGGGRSAAGGGWLEWRPLTALGLISYSVYLVHEPLISCVYRLLQPMRLSRIGTFLLFETVVAPLLIGLGWLFFRLVESRFIRSSSRPA